MNISPSPISYKVLSNHSQPLKQSDKQLTEQESEEEPKYVLSKFVDTKAQEYSEDNATFAEQYQNLEKAYKYFTGQIVALQEQINKLKQSPVQRSLSVDNSANELNKSDANSALNVDHLGANKYKNTQQQDQIDRLELQLGELKYKSKMPKLSTCELKVMAIRIN